MYSTWNISDTTLVNRPDQPDPDAIKMFLGQIPKNWSETEIHELLDPYGPIFSLNILREKGSSLSKGNLHAYTYTIDLWNSIKLFSSSQI